MFVFLICANTVLISYVLWLFREPASVPKHRAPSVGGPTYFYPDPKVSPLGIRYPVPNVVRNGK